jgi:pimeloyl-ACP methyl ester carboxylesterase
MPFAERNGVSVYYEVHGSGRRHLPLLLTPAFSATSEMWAGNVAVLSRQRQVVTWDMRGHGRSDAPDDPGAYTVAAATADMAAVLDAAGVERAIAGGLSLGGFMSLAFHLHHPERVAGLLLCNCGPGFRSDEDRARWNGRAAKIARKFDERGFAGLSYNTEVKASHHRTVTGLAHAARGILALHDATVIESLPHIDVPTLVVASTDDGFRRATDFMAAKIPGATHVVIEDAGHAVNIDQPDAFAAAVIPFLNDVA